MVLTTEFRYGNVESMLRNLTEDIEHCIDPTLDPARVVVDYRADALELLKRAQQIWSERFGWTPEVQGKYGMHVHLYEVTTRDRGNIKGKTVYCAGFQTGIDLVLMTQAEHEFLPIVQPWQRDHGTRTKYATTNAWGEAPVYRVASIRRLGRPKPEVCAHWRTNTCSCTSNCLA